MSVQDDHRGALLQPRPGHPAALHPLLKGAAISLIVLSAVGVGVLTGLIPSPFTPGTTSNTVAAADLPADAPASAASPLSAPPLASAPVASMAPASRYQDDPSPVGPRFGSVPTSQLQAPSCSRCGVVENVRSYEVAGKGTGVGAIGGGVVGGVVGNQFGRGNGRTALTVLGALGGAFAGNQVEKRVRSTTQYEMAVRMDDGTVRTFHSASPYHWQSGEPVRVQNGRVTSRTAASASEPRTVRVSS